LPYSDPEKKRAYDAAHRKAHPEMRHAQEARYRVTHREQLRASQSTYNASHREEQRTYYATHLNERRAYVAVNRATHPEQVRERSHRRRVRIRGGFVERVELVALVKRDGGYCGICHKRVAVAERSIDHVLPVSKGGAHSYANTRLAHLACNLRRGNRGTAQLRLLA